MLVLEKNSLTEEIELLAEKYGKERTSLLPILQDVQRKHNYISEYAQQEVARVLDIHPAEVYGVITFYSFLHHKPRGRNIIHVCRTIACDLAGKSEICATIQRELGIKFGETTKDKKITLEYTNCIGMCDQGPAMIVNEQVFTKLTPEKVVQIINDIK